MVLNLVDSADSKQQLMMETSTTTGRRWNSSGITHHRESIINVGASSGKRFPTYVEPTTHQKINRIIEEHKTKSSSERAKSLSSSSSSNLTNYIVASRGELSRGFFKIPENCRNNFVLTERRKSSVSELVNGREDLSRARISSKGNWDRRREDRSSSRSRSVKNKSAAKDGLGAIPPGKLPTDGILKQSNNFVYKSTDKEVLRALKKSTPSRVVKSTSYQTLSTSDFKKDPRINFNNNNSNSRLVKKSVSFSSDTSFVAKRLPARKPAVHEAKVYHKGVLRDIKNFDQPKKKVREIKENMNQLLLKAARDADELALSDTISRIQRSSSEPIDVNLRDASGRTVISYLAGNGAAEVLETVLNFPGAEVDAADNEGNTALHFAAQAGQAECLNILLQKSTSVELDARNILGFTPLMKAALQGRTKCAKILLFAGANPTLRDHGRGLKAEQWARFCGRHVCADVIERFTRHRLMEKTSCRWGSEPELAAKVLQGKVLPVPFTPVPVASSGFKSKLKRVFRNVGADKSFSLVSQLTNAALCASTPALPKPGDAPVKNLIRPLNIPQLRVTLVAPIDIIDKCEVNYTEKLEGTTKKPPRLKKKTK
ncbi:uncharacterized protein LOC130673657 isoform X2 [Microplitis mediator]|uniref:uncharacterized protein LOC130673657 isoform X2 n=1 Tax=Microplitis mediator TaxID=375433 RepID=UPI002555AE56|nr:uncharacterized protein LOC130673657 isoform X2 [Microplitis mediator]